MARAAERSSPRPIIIALTHSALAAGKMYFTKVLKHSKYEFAS